MVSHIMFDLSFDEHLNVTPFTLYPCVDHFSSYCIKGQIWINNSEQNMKHSESLTLHGSDTDLFNAPR